MSEFFVRRPIVAMVISIITIILGVVSLTRLPIAQYPEITPAEVEVAATYTGANAEVVEQSVATAVEQKVNGVENMIYMKSTNASDGTFKLVVSFEVGSDLDMSNVLTQNRVSEAQASLPEEVKRLGVTVKKKLSFPLLLVTLISPNDSYDNEFLTNYATINVIDELARIRGVGQVTNLGGSEYAMRVWIKPDQLAKLNLTVPDIVRAIQDQNVIAPAGQIGGPPAPEGTEFTYTVRTQERLATADQFGDVIVKSNPDGSQVRVKDVARVELGTQLYTTTSRLNGAQAATIAIYQLPGANGLEVAAAINAAMQELSERFPDDLEYVVALDTTLAITEGIKEIFTTLWQAMALVILVVFIFLQSFRSTLIPALAVPVSLIGTFVVFPLLGFSINTLSLLGLVLAIGIVVDDAIVVVEAVTTKMDQGMNPKEATVAAMREVSGPIIATSLVLVAVFLPVAAMGGITGRLYQQFAITIAISVMISSMNALTLSPALSALLLRPSSEEKKKGPLAKFFDGFNRVFDRVTEHYTGYVGFLVKKSARAAVFLVIIVFAAGLIGRALPGGFVPEEDQGYFLVNVQLPDAASLERSDAVARQVEQILGQTPGIDTYTGVTGYSMLTGSNAPNNAFFFAQLEPWSERGKGKHVFDLIQQVNARFLREIPEAAAFAFGPPAIPGLGNGSGFSIMLQDRGGNTPEYLAEQTESFINAARQRPEIQGAFSTYRASVPQIYAEVDRAKVLKLGASLADVNTTLGSFLGGAYINDFNRFGRLYKAYIQAEPDYRDSTEDMRFFFVRGEEGQMVPLSTMVYTTRTAGPEYTNRFNLLRAAEVTGAPAPGYSSAQALAALEEVAAEVFPPEMTYTWNAMSYQEKAAAGQGAIIFAMALVFVFLILAAQYESWSTPMSVLLGTPFAVFGALAGLLLARIVIGPSYLNNVFAQIGLVMLIGMAAKNAILIVEFAKVERESGKNPVEAAIEAARLRFRPILMTAFSFILGVVPLLVASGAGAEARKVMGMTVFSGMLVATVLGVFMTPALFVVVEKLSGRKAEKAAAAEPTPKPAIEPGRPQQ